MTMVPSGTISLGGTATTTGTGTGPQSYTFVVGYSAGPKGGNPTTGYEPGVITGQAVISPATTTIGGGSAITVLSYNSGQLSLTITGAANTGWIALVVNGNVYLRTAATFAPNTWVWPAGPSPFPATGTLLTVTFTGVANVPVTFNQSVQLELYQAGLGYNSSGTAQISMNDLYVAQLAGVTQGTTISMSNFYNKTAPLYFTYTLNNGSFATNITVTTLAYAYGWNGVSPFYATININGVLGSTSATSPAFATGTPPAGSTIAVNVGSTGYITGMGGTYTPTAGTGVGGPAMSLTYAITLTNTGYIQGGGGSGQIGGGDIYNGGGAGYLIGPGYADYSNPTWHPATLTSGSSFARDPDSGSNNGGAGGGWISQTWSPTINGVGFGTPGTTEVPGAANGGYLPGYAVSGFNSYVLNKASFSPSPLFAGPSAGNGYATNPNSRFRGSVA